MGKYFDRFPIVDYKGKVAKNILAKVDFLQSTKNNIYANFDYTLKEEINRPDLISYVSYGSSYYDWLIYLTNSVIDPYYDYYMPDENFFEFVKEKYDSIESAQRIIMFYRNNWADDSTILSPSQYEVMKDSIKKYYQPILNNANQINSYKRLEEDWTSSTNKIVQLNVESAEWLMDSGILQQGDAKGNIVSVDYENNFVVVNHVTGQFEEGPIEETTVTEVILISQPIPDDEVRFWSPVSAYEYELEKNELKKHISVLKNDYLQDIDIKFSEEIKK